MKATSVNQSDRKSKALPADLLSGEQIRRAVEEALESTPFIDIHTHLFSPAFGKLGLWGIDELLTYHYLEAEFFRSSNTTPEQYWKLSKREQADAIWQALFVENSPIPQFHAVLRLDRILWGWPRHWQQLASQGYAVDEKASGKSIAEVRRFLADWHERMRPLYMAVSLADTFFYPDDSITSKILGEAVLPSCREFGLPMSLMIGVRRQVNPALRLAGDAVGRADLCAVENLCRSFPDNRFLVSVLSRENQHELCVYARKFNNLMPFGCWWFLNNPSIVEEITRERIEMLGTSFIPQHSDARVLEQVIYKWRNTRRTLAPILTNAYRLIQDDGGGISRRDIQRDVNRLFRSNFENWTGLRAG